MNGNTKFQMALAALFTLMLLASPALAAGPGGEVFNGSPAFGPEGQAEPLPGCVASSRVYIPGPGVDTSPRPITSRLTGEKSPFILCVEFDDVSATKPLSQFDTLLAKMDEYYNEASYGVFSISGNVSSQWYKSIYNMDHYGADSGTDHDSLNGAITELVKEAVTLADGDVDFSDYDYDSDGKVDNIIVVHAGNDQAESGVANDIWSHKGSVPGGKAVDGVTITDYTMLAETSPLGTFVHEFSHDLGLPDLYDYGMESDGIGLWGLMGMGNYLDYGNSPVHLCAWSKVQLGWIDPVVVDDLLVQESIPCVERNPVVYKLPIGSSEYFLVENRQRVDYDAYLPGRGLVIYHVDEAQWPQDPFDIRFYRPNEYEDHKFVDVEESTPQQDLDLGYTESDSNVGDSTDPWFDSVSGFSFYSDPGSASYSAPSAYNMISVTNISALGSPGSDMKADLAVNLRTLTIDSPDQLAVGVGVGITKEFVFECTSNRKAGDVLTPVKDGTHLEWTSFNTSGVTVSGPGVKGYFKLSVTVPEDALSGSKADIVVRFSNLDGYVSRNLSVTVSVEPRFEVGFSEPGNLTLYNQQMTPVRIEVANLGNYQLELACAAEGTKDFDLAVVPPVFNLSAFDRQNITVKITPSAEARGGQDYTFTLTARVKSNPGLYNSTTFKGSINARRDVVLDLAAKPAPLTPGENNQLDLVVSNPGNTGEELTLTYALDADWTVSLESSVVSVAPSGARTVPVTVSVPQDAVFDGNGAAFSILATAKDPGLAVHLNRTLFIEKVYHLEVEQELKVSKYRMDPDSELTIGLVLINHGNVEDVFSLSAAFPEELEADLEADTVAVAPSQEVLVNLTVRSDFSARVGDLVINVTAVSGSNASYQVVKALTVYIQPSTRLQISFTNSLQDEEGVTHFEPGDVLEFSLIIKNVGNFIDTVKVSANITKGLGEVVYLDDSGAEVEQFEMDMGEKRTLTVRLTVRGGTEVGRETVELVVTNAQGKRYTAPIDLKNDNDEEGLPMGAVLAAAAVLLLLVILVVVIVAVLTRRRKKKNGTEAAPAPGENVSGAQEEAPAAAEASGEDAMTAPPGAVDAPPLAEAPGDAAPDIEDRPDEAGPGTEGPPVQAEPGMEIPPDGAGADPGPAAEGPDMAGGGGDPY